MNEKFEELLNWHLEAYFKSYQNDPFRFGLPPNKEGIVQVLILQKLIEIGHDLTAIRESLALREALRETEDWTQSS